MQAWPPFRPTSFSLRLDDIATHLGASVIFGQGSVLDREYSEIVIGSQRSVIGDYCQDMIYMYEEAIIISM
jgi:hypothetical protein